MAAECGKCKRRAKAFQNYLRDNPQKNRMLPATSSACLATFVGKGPQEASFLVGLAPSTPFLLISRSVVTSIRGWKGKKDTRMGGGWISGSIGLWLPRPCWGIPSPNPGLHLPPTLNQLRTWPTTERQSFNSFKVLDTKM